jgi:hypothetical protein
MLRLSGTYTGAYYRSFLSLSGCLLLLGSASALQARAVLSTAVESVGTNSPAKIPNQDSNQDFARELDRRQAAAEQYAWELEAVEAELDRVTQRALVPQAPLSELRHAYPPVAGLAGSVGPREAAPGPGRDAGRRLPTRHFTFQAAPAAERLSASRRASRAIPAARRAFYFATHNGYF